MKSLLPIAILNFLLPLTLWAHDPIKKTTMMSMQEMVSALDSAGYQQIKEIKMHIGGAYEVKTINAAGEPVDFWVQTPADIVTQTVKILTLVEVVKKVMEADYANVTEIRDAVTYYEMKVHDKEGQPYRLLVNKVSGKISKIKT